LRQQRHRHAAFTATRPHGHRKAPWQASKLRDQSRLGWPKTRNFETRKKVLHRSTHACPFAPSSASNPARLRPLLMRASAAVASVARLRHRAERERDFCDQAHRRGHKRHSKQQGLGKRSRALEPDPSVSGPRRLRSMSDQRAWRRGGLRASVLTQVRHRFDAPDQGDPDLPPGNLPSFRSNAGLRKEPTTQSHRSHPRYRSPA
jgi:hypothetical protein